MKHKFKIGDKVSIERFPMGMGSGDCNDPREWFLNNKVFTIAGFRNDNNLNHTARIPCLIVQECGWYFDVASMVLVKRGKKPKEHKSWVLNCGK